MARSWYLTMNFSRKIGSYTSLGSQLGLKQQTASSGCVVKKDIWNKMWTLSNILTLKMQNSFSLQQVTKPEKRIYLKKWFFFLFTFPADEKCTLTFSLSLRKLAAAALPPESNLPSNDHKTSNFPLSHRRRLTSDPPDPLSFLWKGCFGVRRCWKMGSDEKLDIPCPRRSKTGRNNTITRIAYLPNVWPQIHVWRRD